MGTTRVLLVEDEPRWQAAIRALLSQIPGVEVVAMADGYDAAMTAFHQTQPDLLMADWRIDGERTGLEVAHACVASGLSPEAVLLVSGSDPREIPAHGYAALAKTDVAEHLVSVVQAIIARRFPVASPSVSDPDAAECKIL